MLLLAFLVPIARGAFPPQEREELVEEIVLKYLLKFLSLALWVLAVRSAPNAGMRAVGAADVTSRCSGGGGGRATTSSA